jgi:hypothetical protein
MDRQWAVALALGGQTFQPKTTGAPDVTFTMLELGGRYRIRPAIELALTLAAGGAMKGQFSTGGLWVDFRYRFMAEQPWNVFALIGLGSVGVSGKDAADVDRKGRGALRLGGGVERRIGAWGIAAELRLWGAGENKDVPAVDPPTTAYQLARYGVSGASLMLGGTFYF